MLKKQRHASDRGNNRQVRILARIEINETSDNPNRVTRIIPCTDAKVAAGSMQPSRCEISLAYHATPEQNRDDEGHTARSRISNNLSACVVRNVSGPSRKIGPIAFDHPPKVDPSATPPFLFTLSTIRATKQSKEISISANRKNAPLSSAHRAILARGDRRGFPLHDLARRQVHHQRTERKALGRTAAGFPAGCGQEWMSGESRPMDFLFLSASVRALMDC